jgi:hypothetical protein
VAFCVNKVCRWTASQVPGWPSEFQPSRALSDGGTRLFFESFDALLPGDTNGKADIYEWERPGTGTCDAQDADYFAQNGGCLALISSGASSEDSGFVDADADGSDVFFETQSSLVGSDTGLIDIYDARVGGGFEQDPPPEPLCAGDACQPLADQPGFQTPSSSTFRGPGNPEGTGSCDDSARAAARLNARAKYLADAAKQAPDSARAQAMRRKARRLGRRARRLGQDAKRCRQTLIAGARRAGR